MRLNHDVMFMSHQSWKPSDEIGNTLARLGHVFENQSDGGSTVVRQVNFGNSDPAASLTAKHSAVLQQTLGDVSLAHRSAYDTSAVACGDDVDRTRCRDV